MGEGEGRGGGGGGGEGRGGEGGCMFPFGSRDGGRVGGGYFSSFEVSGRGERGGGGGGERDGGRVGGGNSSCFEVSGREGGEGRGGGRGGEGGGDGREEEWEREEGVGLKRRVGERKKGGWRCFLINLLFFFFFFCSERSLQIINGIKKESTNTYFVV